MKTILTIAALFIVFSAAQAQKLPDTIKIKLSARQFQVIAGKIDSLETLLVNTSTLPSNALSAFNHRVNQAFDVLYKQVQEQLVADKKKGAVK